MPLGRTTTALAILSLASSCTRDADDEQSIAAAPIPEAPIPEAPSPTVGQGGGGGTWKPSPMHNGGSPGAPVIEFCGMSIPDDTQIVWCNHRPGLDLGRLAAFPNLSFLLLWGEGDVDPPLSIDCAGLASARALVEVEIGGLDCRGLEALASLPALTELRIAVHRREQLAAVARSKSLTRLVLHGPGLADLGPLAELPQLRELLLIGATELRDLRPLTSLPQLRELNLSWTGVTDLEPLRGSSLHELNLANTAIADIGPLADTRGLQHLRLNNTRVTSLEPLRKLTQLRTLTLSMTAVHDLDPLTRLIRLEKLWLNCATVDPRQLETLRVSLPRLKDIFDASGTPCPAAPPSPASP